MLGPRQLARRQARDVTDSSWSALCLNSMKPMVCCMRFTTTYSPPCFHPCRWQCHSNMQQAACLWLASIKSVQRDCHGLQQHRHMQLQQQPHTREGHSKALCHSVGASQLCCVCNSTKCHVDIPSFQQHRWCCEGQHISKCCQRVVQCFQPNR